MGTVLGQLLMAKPSEWEFISKTFLNSVPMSGVFLQEEKSVFEMLCVQESLSSNTGVQEPKNLYQCVSPTEWRVSCACEREHRL